MYPEKSIEWNVGYSAFWQGLKISPYNCLVKDYDWCRGYHFAKRNYQPY